MSVRKETWKKKDKDGRPYLVTAYRVDVQVELPDGRKVRERKASADWNKREAEEWERQKRHELLHPSPKRVDAPLVSDFFREWIESDSVARGNEDSTISEKWGDYNRYIEPHLAKLRLDQLDLRNLTKFQAALLKVLSKKSTRNTIGTLHRMLVYAADIGAIARVPKFPELKIPRTTAFDYFNRAEIEQLLGPVNNPVERAELLVAFDTGVRTGEQVALKWGDINFASSDAYPHGWVSIVKASSRGKVKVPKSGETRKVPLTQRCADALRAIRGLRHLADVLIFPDKDDSTKVEDVREPDRRVARACARAGLRRLRRYGARHSFASNHVALGTPLLQVSKWLGHSDIRITASTYAHLAPTDGTRWLAAYEAPTMADATSVATNRSGS